jgi:hypothetical protein
MHDIPTHLEVTDKLVFGLTAGQTLFCAGSLFVGYSLWKRLLFLGLPPIASLPLAMFATAMLIAVSLIRPEGRSLDQWCAILLRYLFQPRVYLPSRKGRAAGTTGKVGRRGRRTGEVQRAFVAACAIVGGNLLCLRRQGRSATLVREDTYCAAVEVTPINFLLRSEEEQADIIAGFEQWLNSLRFPIQLLVQVRRLDLGPYVSRVQGAVDAHLDSAILRGRQDVLDRWAEVAADHVTFVEGLASKKLLLERHFYVLLRFEEDAASLATGVTLVRRLALLLSQGRLLQPPEAETELLEPSALSAGEDEPEEKETEGLQVQVRTRQRQLAAKRQLDLRVSELARHFERLGVPIRRLEGLELASLYYCALTPERATTHPLPAEMATGPAGECTSLDDALAPAAVEVFADHLRLEGECTRTLALTGYPRRVSPGWLARIIDEDLPLDASLHIHPRNPRAALQSLRRHLAQYEASAALDQRLGRLRDPERDIAVEDVTRLQERLERGTTRVFDFGVYLRLYTPRRGGLIQLEHRTEQLHGVLDHLGMAARPALWEQDLALASVLPQSLDALRRTRFFDTETIATAWPFATSGISMSAGLLFGLVPVSGSLVILDPFSSDFENANQVVFGVSGGGKSYATKLWVIRSLMSGISAVIVDPENEYRRLSVELGGQSIRLAPGSNQHVNPFDLPRLGPNLEHEEDPLAEKIQSLHALFDLLLAERGPGHAGTLSRREKALLDRVLYAAYGRAGITAERGTHDRPPPLLREVYQLLTEEPFHAEDASHLAVRLHRYVEGALAHLFAAPTNVELDNPLLVFNIADLDEELRPLGLYLVSDCLWTHIRREELSPRPRLLLVDEAWSLLQFPEGGRFLSSLVRRARKRYLGVVTITQDINDFLGSEWGRTILQNSATKLLMKQDSSSIDLISETFQLSAGERRQLLTSEKGEGLLFALGARIGIRIEASPKEHGLATTDPRETAFSAIPVAPATRVASVGQTPTETAEPASTCTVEEPVEGPAPLDYPWIPAIPSAFAALAKSRTSRSDSLLELPLRFFRRPRPRRGRHPLAVSADDESGEEA